MEQGWAPAHAGYHEGKVSRALLDEARRTVSVLVGAGDVAVWPDLAAATTGVLSRWAQVHHFAALATTATDALVVADAARRVAATHSLPMHALAVDGRGRVDLGALNALPTPALLVTHAVNQEIGVLQAPLQRWRAGTDSRLLIDASACFGWAALPTGADALLLDPRAWGAPAGAVFTAMHRSPPVDTTFDNVPAAVTAALCAQKWASEAPAAAERVARQLQRIRKGVEEVPGVDVHGGGPGDAPHILSVSVLYIDAEALQTRLDARGFAVGSGSACASRTGQPSHVLAAIGGLTSGNIRIGLPPDVPEADIDRFIDAFAEVVAEIRGEMGTSAL
jgi:cysteine desulfurase